MKTLFIFSALLFTSTGHARAEGDLLSRAPQKSKQAENPYKGDERAERAGLKLYTRNCSECHDAKGGTKAPPLEAEFIRRASPGALFWVLRNGSVWNGMPPFAHLPAEQRWQIIAYLTSSRKHLPARR